VDITEEIIDRVLKDVAYIYSLSFTGGEPFLNPKAIMYVFDVIDRNNIDLGDFWLATNGKIWDTELIFLMMRKSAELRLNYGNDYSKHLAVSQDEFHDQFLTKEDKIRIEMFKELAMYDDSKENRGSKRASLIREGRAKRNGLGEREPKYYGMSDFDLDGDEYRYDGLIYINALGDVLLDCDFSYVTQKKMKIGNVLEDTLLNILIKEHKRINAKCA